MLRSGRGLAMKARVDGETGLWKRLSRFLSPRLCHNTRGSKPEARLLSPSKSPFPRWLADWLDRKGLSFDILTVASQSASQGRSTGGKGGRGAGVDGDEGGGGLLSSPSASLFLHLLNLSSFDRLSKEARKWCFLLPHRLYVCLCSFVWKWAYICLSICMHVLRPVICILLR